VFKTTIKGIRTHKLRLLSTFLSIVVGVAFLSGTLTLTDTITRTFDDLFADVNEGTDAFVRSDQVIESDFGDERSRIDAAVLDEVVAADGVEDAEGFIQTNGVYIIGSDGDPVGDTSGFGAPTFGGNWPTVDQLNPFVLLDGSRAPETGDQVVIDKKSADDGDLSVGDTVTITAPRQDPKDYELVGIARFGTADSPGGASYAAFVMAEAQERLARPGTFDGIAVVAADGVSQAEVTAAISEVVPDGVEVLTGEEKTEEDQNAIAEGLAGFTTFLLGFVGIALIVGMFVIYNTFTIIVAQRLRENALLRAIGASRRQVIGAVLLEAIVVGIVGAAVGLLLGVAVASGLKSALGALGIDIPSTGLVVEPGKLIFAGLLGAVVTVISAIVPAIRAARVPPVAAMRDVAIDQPFRARNRLIITVVMLGLGAWLLRTGLSEGDARILLGIVLLFTGVIVGTSVIARPIVGALGLPLAVTRGVTGSLARENARRSPRRTAATASALTIGISIIAFFLVFSSSLTASIDKVVDEQFFGDFVVTTPGFGAASLPPSATEEIRELPGVGDATGIRLATGELEGKAVFIGGFDAETAFRLFDIGVVAGDPGTLGPNDIGLSSNQAESLEVGMGDTVELAFAETGQQTFTVGLLYDDEVIAGGQFLDLQAFDEHAPQVGDAQVFIQIADGADPEDVRAGLATITDRFPQVELQDLTEFKKAQSAQFAPILGLISAMASFSVIIALIGIANTVALSVLERTREIGLLRAVGAARGQIRSAIRWESAIIAVFGTILGLGIGTGLAYAIVRTLEDEGFGAFDVPWPVLVVLLAVAALLGMLAALRPASKAAKLDVLQAIATE
jgi:putative ABC transport system permease protein